MSCDDTQITISIHTFLAEGDAMDHISESTQRISIHTFLAEGDGFCFWLIEQNIQFQSTPSSRKVTLLLTDSIRLLPNFNPHLPRGR